MAVTTRRSIGGKTNIYWTKDSDDKDNIVKVHFPGVNLEPTFDIKEPMVKKPTKPRKPDTLMLQKRSIRIDAMKQIKSLRSNKENITSNKKHDDDDDVPVRDNEQQDKKSPKKIGLKDLKPEDKKRVANLVKELAKVGEERELALSQLTEERVAFEERLQILQEEYESNINEKLNLQKRFLELQELLTKYKDSEKGQVTPHHSARNKSHHTTQTSPFSPFGVQHKSPLKDLPGNERKLSPRHKLIDTSDAKHSKHAIQESERITTQDWRQLNISEVKVSRHPTSANAKMSSPLEKQPTREQRHSRESTPLPGNSDFQIIPGKTPVEIPQESKPSVIISTLPGPSASSVNDVRLQHEQSRQITGQDTRGVTSVSQQSPVVRKVARKRHNSEDVSGSVQSVLSHSEALSRPHDQALTHQLPMQTQNPPTRNQPSSHPLPTQDQASTDRPPQNQVSYQNPSTHNQALSRHPPPKFTDDSEPPVYANKLFDIGVTRPGGGRPLIPPSLMDNYSRSQSDTSQSFSAELDAVYRLYCREYELQLQLQQQQLELQKQQLQLQQQLQQLELCQQRQQAQQQVAAPINQQQPSTPAKPIIRATPIPTPAPQPSIQPRLDTPLDGLEPTTIDSSEHHQGIDKTGTGQGVQTVRRITSSKRPQKSQSRPSHYEGSFTSHQPIPQGPATDENLNSFQHHSSRQQSQWTQGSVSKEIINPEEAARFKFSLYRDQKTSPVKHSGIDWSNASDLDFRKMQESKIREHYGLQYPLHSTRASLPLRESFPTRASYALYERAKVAEEPLEMNGRDVNGMKINGRELDVRDYSYNHVTGGNTRENSTQQYSLQRSDPHLPSHQQYSIHTTKDRAYHHDNDYPDSESVIEPWVSHSISLQQDLHPGNSQDTHRSNFLHRDIDHDTSFPHYHSTSLRETHECQDTIHDLNYPLQIIDLVNELEDEPTITSPSGKPCYSVYASSPLADPSVISGILDSTDSGYSNVSRDVYDRKTALHVELDGDPENEERDVLEDIFFI